mgnify:CR=1 FL=1
MKAEIVSVGTELLLGQIVNTNARFLSEHLANLGIDVFYHTVVGDNPRRLRQALETARSRAELVLLTGGLGPTRDDITKETVAELAGARLIVHEPSLLKIREYFLKKKQAMTENNRKQALVFEGGEVFPNEAGMAPGMAYSDGDVTYLLLPGPPEEMEPMFSRHVIPFLLRKMGTGDRIESRVLRFYGIGEAALEHCLEDLIDNQSNPTIAPLAKEGEVTVRLTVKHPSETVRTQLLDEVEKEILSRMGSHFYGRDGQTLFTVLAERMKKRGWTLAVAESLTGGLFQKEVTALPGASTWFAGGIVSYSNEVKTGILGVKRETIRRFGAVSGECAREMAEQVRVRLNVDVGLSFTGVAGPDPLEGKEPGTVFIGVSLMGQPATAVGVQLLGDRNTIRIRAVKAGAWQLLKEIEKAEGPEKSLP